MAGSAERAAIAGGSAPFGEARRRYNFVHDRIRRATSSAPEIGSLRRFVVTGCPAVIQTWYAARGLCGPACDLVSTLKLGRAGFQESLVVARATRGWFRGAHSIGMIVKLAAQTTVNATALIITAFLLRGWIRIHPFVFRLRWRSRDHASGTADCSFF